MVDQTYVLSLKKTLRDFYLFFGRPPKSGKRWKSVAGKRAKNGPSDWKTQKNTVAGNTQKTWVLSNIPWKTLKKRTRHAAGKRYKSAGRKR